MWGDCSYIASHYLYLRISFTRLILASLTVVYTSGVGVVMKVKCRNRRSSLSTMEMHVDAICEFVCIQCYPESKSISLIILHIDVHLRRVATIICIILRIQKP